MANHVCVTIGHVQWLPICCVIITFKTYTKLYQKTIMFQNNNNKITQKFSKVLDFTQ